MKANKTIIGVCCAVLAIIWGILAAKTFNPKPDLNGDNFNYYIYASSLATGHGYSDLSTPDMRPTAGFPPGYPAIRILGGRIALSSAPDASETVTENWVFDGTSVWWPLRRVCSVHGFGISRR